MGVYCLFCMEMMSKLKLSYLYKNWNNSAFTENIYLNLNFYNLGNEYKERWEGVNNEMDKQGNGERWEWGKRKEENRK